MKKALAQIDVQDAFLLAGAVSIVGGIAWIYPPAGLIAAGLLFLTIGVFLMSKASPRPASMSRGQK